jgi:hypothetical protein
LAQRPQRRLLLYPPQHVIELHLLHICVRDGDFK